MGSIKEEILDTFDFESFSLNGLRCPAQSPLPVGTSYSPLSGCAVLEFGSFSPSSTRHDGEGKRVRPDNVTGGRTKVKILRRLP